MTSSDSLSWLLELENPSARYLTLTRLLDRPGDDPDVVASRSAIPGWGPARAILDAQWPEGYWMRPGVGYSPKHKATTWQVVFLAALGIPLTESVSRACGYVLDHSLLRDGRFSAQKTRSGAVTCLNGSLMRAMLRLGYRDGRLEAALEALAQAVLQDEFRCRFNAPRPLPARMCDGLPCAWGAIKALAAFAELPAARRTPNVQAAIEIGKRFLLDGDLAQGDYPTATRTSPLWCSFGFPLGYTSDLLEALEVLGLLGIDPAYPLDAALNTVRKKQDDKGRWQLEHTPHNMWASFGRVGDTNKWVTIRALLVLKLWQDSANRANS